MADSLLSCAVKINDVNTSTREYTANVMKRPNGVTVLACIFLLAAISLVYGFLSYMSAMLEHPSWIALSMLNFSIAVTLCIALFKVHNWSRWAVIAVGLYWLLLLPREASAACGIVDIVYAGIRTSFCVWVIWYMSQPKIKAAFRKA